MKSADTIGDPHAHVILVRIAALLTLFLMPILLFGQDTGCDKTPPPPPLTVDPPPLFVVDKDTNIASGILRIRNTAKDPVPLRLTVSDFTVEMPDSKNTTRKVALGTIPTFSSADPASKADWDSGVLKREGRVNLKLDVSKLWEFGESTAELCLDNHLLANLKAAKFRAPFAVKSAAAAGEDDGLFYRGKEGLISLRNDDPMTYPVQWSMIIDGRVIQSGTEVLHPGVTPLHIKFDNALFSWPATGMLQDDLERSKLMLRLAPLSSVQDVSLVGTELPLKVRLRYFSRGWQQGWNLVWIILFLAVGAAISIALNIGIPNQTKRNAIHQLIHDLSNRINSLGPGADSSAVTFLRVERSRLEKRLHDLYWFSINLSAELPLIQQAIDLLNGRVQIVSEVRDIQDTLCRAPSVPPTIMDSVQASCQKTLKDVVRPDLSSTDVASLRAANAAVQQQIAALGQADAVLEAAITARENNLKTSIPANIKADPIWKVFDPDLTPILTSVSANAGTSITPNQYFIRDMAAQIATACANYAMHRQLLSDPALIGAAEKEALRAKAFLQLQTYSGLVQARSVFECIRENVTQDRILNALKSAPPKAEILFTPSTPSTYDLVWLQVRFLDPGLNTDAVRQQLTFKWSLGRGKYGWSVSHYFTQPRGKKKSGSTRPEPNNVEVEFLDSAQNPVVDSSGQPVKLQAEIPVQTRRRGGHIGVELMRTGLALLVALLGLIAVAQEKIANLPVVSAILAVVIIGITADSVKNLLSK